jgi:hypothetical protein
MLFSVDLNNFLIARSAQGENAQGIQKQKPQKNGSIFKRSRSGRSAKKFKHRYRLA